MIYNFVKIRNFVISFLLYSFLFLFYHANLYADQEKACRDAVKSHATLETKLECIGANYKAAASQYYSNASSGDLYLICGHFWYPIYKCYDQKAQTYKGYTIGNPWSLGNQIQCEDGADEITMADFEIMTCNVYKSGLWPGGNVTCGRFWENAIGVPYFGYIKCKKTKPFLGERQFEHMYAFDSQVIGIKATDSGNTITYLKNSDPQIKEKKPESLSDLVARGFITRKEASAIQKDISQAEGETKKEDRRILELYFDKKILVEGKLADRIYDKSANLDRVKYYSSINKLGKEEIYDINKSKQDKVKVIEEDIIDQYRLCVYSSQRSISKTYTKIEDKFSAEKVAKFGPPAVFSKNIYGGAAGTARFRFFQFAPLLQMPPGTKVNLKSSSNPYEIADYDIPKKYEVSHVAYEDDIRKDWRSKERDESNEIYYFDMSRKLNINPNNSRRKVIDGYEDYITENIHENYLYMLELISKYGSKEQAELIAGRKSAVKYNRYCMTIPMGIDTPAWPEIMEGDPIAVRVPKIPEFSVCRLSEKGKTINYDEKDQDGKYMHSAYCHQQYMNGLLKDTKYQNQYSNFETPKLILRLGYDTVDKSKNLHQIVRKTKDKKTGDDISEKFESDDNIFFTGAARKEGEDQKSSVKSETVGIFQGDGDIQTFKLYAVYESKNKEGKTEIIIQKQGKPIYELTFIARIDYDANEYCVYRFEDGRETEKAGCVPHPDPKSEQVSLFAGGTLEKPNVQLVVWKESYAGDKSNKNLANAKNAVLFKNVRQIGEKRYAIFCCKSCEFAGYTTVKNMSY